MFRSIIYLFTGVPAAGVLPEKSDRLIRSCVYSEDCCQVPDARYPDIGTISPHMRGGGGAAAREN